jgi:hypothetical protein
MYLIIAIRVHRDITMSFVQFDFTHLAERFRNRIIDHYPFNQTLAIQLNQLQNFLIISDNRK